MPNHLNITRPITLIGGGRSGTSLLQNSFGSHPDCEIVGESADLIFGVWHACQLSEGIVRGDKQGEELVSEPARRANAVRAVFLSMFPSEKKYWMQKPISLPYCFHYFMSENSAYSEFCAWYWDVASNVFPHGKYFTILRHPFDIVLSAKDYWARTIERSLDELVYVADLITHPRSRVDYAVSYDRLLIDPESELRKLCEFAEIPFHSQMVDATKRIYVPTPGVMEGSNDQLRQRTDQKFSRSEHWSTVARAASQSQLESIAALWQKFGFQLELPH